MKVTGTYYGAKFTGEINHKEANWENGQFEKSEGINVHIKLDNDIEYVCGKHTMKREAGEGLFLQGWVSGKSFHWGECNA